MNYFLHIAYDGSKYRGWQRQPKARSVQETIEKALQKIFNTEITVYGCGRTDAGVHASQYFIHIKLDEAVNFDLKFRLNKNLPDDISVFDILSMDETQHCRYDAISRTYDYFIHLEKEPVLTRYSSFYEFRNLDLLAMQEATRLLTQYDDFKAICKQPDFYKHTRCTVTHAHLYVNANETRLCFNITANRFLRGMVRLCIYYLLEIGKGKLSVARFEQQLASMTTTKDLKPALPNGLHLSKVVYPYLDMPLRSSSICALLKQDFNN